MAKTPVNRDLIDKEPFTLDISVVVRELVDIVGRRVVAYITDLKSTREIVAWLNRESPPRADRDQILRSALQATRYVRLYEGPASAAAWFVGTNAMFNFDSPADRLHEHGIEARKDVVRAAQAFVVDALVASETAEREAMPA
jgi:hypothetical protein